MDDFYCRICSVRKVANDGDVCSNCQDPYREDNSAGKDYGNNQQPAVQNTSTQTTGSYGSNGSGFSGRSRRPVIPSVPGGNGSSNTVTRPNNTQTRVSQNTQRTVTPAAQSNNAPAASTPAAKVSRHSPQVEGVVRNLVEGKETHGMVWRWCRSFFLGTSFTRSDDQTEFQVFSNWVGSGNAQGYAADKVIVYGTMQNNKPVQDNTVRIYGRRNRNNAIIADVIENTTDGTRTEFYPVPLSGIAVRIITLIVIAIIAGLIMMVSTFVSGWRGFHIDFSNISDSLLNLAVTIGSALGMYYFGKKTFRLVFHSGDSSQLLMNVVGLFVCLGMFVTYVTQIL